MHQFNAWNGIIWSRGNMDFLWYHLWSQSNNSQLSIGISHWSRPGLVEAESWCLPGNEYVIGFVFHARVYFILCFPTVCVWKPAAGNELALQDNCWCAAGRLLGAVRCQRFVQCIKVVLVCFQEQCRTIHYIELPSKQITKYNDGNIIMFAGRFKTISTLPSSVGAARA